MDDRSFSIAVDIFLRTGIIAVGWNINKYARSYDYHKEFQWYGGRITTPKPAVSPFGLSDRG